MFKSNFYRGLTAGMISLALPLSQAAAESSDERWQYEAAVYLWGASLGGATATGDDFEMSFGDILDNLDMTFMGMLQARKGKWSLLADVIYMDLSHDLSSTAKLNF